MTNRKNYNSILFLTVYFGLVLVGATPQVLAHTATNSLFDIRNEWEIKEDLDNKPDDSCAELKAKTDEQDNQFIEEYIEFVSASLKKYPSKGGFGYLDGYNSNTFPSLRKNIFFWEFEFNVSDNGLFSKAVFKSNSTKDLADFASSLSQSFYFKRCNSQDLPKKTLYEGTTISFASKQILIVTRLPRGSIDSLLKQ